MNAFLRVRAAVMLCALLLAACVTAPRAPVTVNPEQVKAFELNGRFNVRNERGAYPGRIRWQHEPRRDEVWLYSPLGSAVAHMQQMPSGATLATSDGKEYRASHVTDLAQRVLGYELPLDAMQYWVRGLAWPGIEDVKRQDDGAGRAKQIQQGAWKIDYLDWQPAGADGLPSKLDLAGEGLRMRLVVDDWKIDAGGR